MPPKSTTTQKRIDTINQLFDEFLPPEKETSEQDTNWRRTLTQGIVRLKEELSLSQTDLATILEERYQEEHADSAGRLLQSRGKQDPARKRDVFSDETIKSLLSKDWPTVKSRQHKLKRLITSLIWANADRNLDVVLDGASEDFVFLRAGNELYRGPIDDPLDVQSEKNKSEPTERYYLVYYWRHANKGDKREEKVGCGLIKTPHSGWQGATMTLFYRNDTDPEKPKTFVLKTSVDPQILGGVLYLRLEDEESENLETARAKVLTQLTVRVNNSDRRRFLLGSYSTVHRDPGEPTAGLVVLEKVTNQRAGTEKITKFLKDPTLIEPAIFQYLANRRVDVPNIDIRKLEDFPLTKHLSHLADLALSYLGYYYNSATDKVVLFTCVISGQGRVSYHSNKDTHSVHQMDGFVRMLEEMVRIDFHYIHDYEAFRLQYNMEKAYTEVKETNYWRGVYAGFDKGLVRPVAGHIVLKPISEGKDLDLKDILLADFRKLPGGNDILDLLKVPKKIAEETENEHPIDEASELFSFAGEYVCLMSRPVHERSAVSAVVPYQLSIDHQGVVTMRRKGVLGVGRAIVDRERFLCINFMSDEGDFGGVLAFSLHESNSSIDAWESIDYIFGTFSRIGYGQHLEASAVVLVPTETYDYSDSSMLINRWSSDFTQLDKDFKGALTFLNGRLNRIVRVPMTANRPIRPRDKDYRRGPFYAACYLAQLYSRSIAPRRRQQVIDRSAIVKHLQEAWQMGFAAENFAGVPIPELIKNMSSQSGSMNEEDRIKLELELTELVHDYFLLETATQLSDQLGHPDLIEHVHRLWPGLPEKGELYEQFRDAGVF